MSDIKYYRDLLQQRRRIEAFRRAIHAVVQPGDRVLEIGAGLGTFAFFAADAGAAQVWAVEGDPIVHVASTIGQWNGYADRVEFMRGWIPSVEIPAPADVLIFEDFPPRLLNGQSFRLLRWAHQRYVTADVRAVPAAATLFVAPVSDPKLWQEVAPFGVNGPDDVRYDVDWSASREYLVNQPINVKIPAAALAGEPKPLGTVRFDRSPAIRDLGGEAQLTVNRSCPLHGLAFWFDLDLGGGELLSNAPGARPGSWGHLFLPVDNPLAASPSEPIRAQIEARESADGVPGWLAWEVATGGKVWRGYELAGVPAGVIDYESQTPDFVPHLSRDGALEALVFQLTNGERSVREIGTEVRRHRTDLSQAEAERVVTAVLRNRIRLDEVFSGVLQEGSK